MSGPALEALKTALESDDQRLTQDNTTTPPPLMCVQDWPVEGACCLGLAGWLGEGLTTVGEVEEYFAKLCFQADQRLGEPAACRWFLNAWDDTPRAEMFALLLAEVEYELGKRGAINPPPPDPLVLRIDGMGKPGGLPSGNEAQVVRTEET